VPLLVTVARALVSLAEFIFVCDETGTCHPLDIPDENADMEASARPLILL